MTDYRPYTVEWSRKRYLSEALQKYFEDNVPSEIILKDIKSILDNWAFHYREKEAKIQDILDSLN